MAELFGFEFKRKEKDEPVAPSFTPKEQDDGALVVSASGSYGTYVDLDGTVRTEAELVTKYREMSLHPEIDIAIDEIVNHSMSFDEDKTVRIVLDDINLPDKVKKSIYSEFENVLNIIGFNTHGYDTFRRWYIDGRLYYHVVIDIKNPQEGIKELRYIDPRKIRKIREVSKKRARGADVASGSAVITKTENEYYIFNDKGFNIGNKLVGPTTTGLKIAKDSIVHVTSGLTDTNGTMVLSFLHKAIKPLNQLRTLEDAVVIYRISRAPERRLWYIDVGNLPKMKAEQYVRDIMVKHKNRLIYDANTGELRDDRKFMTMLEDYWLPRREGGRGTEVSTLPAGQNLGEMEDVNYFKEKLYGSLHVPLNRLDKNNMFSMGAPSEITREELRFGKFIDRLRTKFNLVFMKVLEKQLVLKGVITIEDWEILKNSIKFDYAKDSYFTELKDSEIFQNRINLVQSMGDMIGRYYSNYYVRKKILKQTDEEIDEMDEQIESDMEEQQEMNAQMGLGPDGQPAEQGGGQGGGSSQPAQSGQNDKLREAKSVYQQLKNKSPKSKEEYSKLQKAVQVIAKSDDEAAKRMITYRQQKAGTNTQ
jgi:hypothetical protein